MSSVGQTQHIARNTAITVTTAIIEVAPARERKVIYYKNISTGGQVISVFMSGAAGATANQGQVLNPQDWIIDSDSAEYKCWRGPITAIASAAGATLTIYERVE